MKGDENDKTFDHPTGFEKPNSINKDKCSLYW